MKNTEIKEIKEYCWGSIVTIIEGECTKKVITAKAELLIPAFVITNLVALVIGLVIG